MLFSHVPVFWVSRPDRQYYLGALGSLEEPEGLRRRRVLLSLDLLRQTKDRTHAGESLEERS